MKFNIARDAQTDAVTFIGSFPRDELMRLRLSPPDNKVLTAGSSKSASPADRLLALEMIYRRHAEQVGT